MAPQKPSPQTKQVLNIVGVEKLTHGRGIKSRDNDYEFRLARRTTGV